MCANMSRVEDIPPGSGKYRGPWYYYRWHQLRMLLFFVMCYDKIFDTSGGIMRKKPGMNEWGEYFYSFTRSCPVIILPANAVN